MFLVGLTGGIGSGKSEAARIFSELGVPVVDTDAIAHLLTSPGQPVLEQIFKQLGAQFRLADGSLNRAALRDVVFSDPDARLALEAILHPAIFESVLQAVAQNPDAAYQVIAIPLLFESPRYQQLVQRSLTIDCDEALQISRAAARNGLSAETVKAIMRVQLPREERNRRSDDVILNNGSLDALREQIQAIHKNYMRACIVSD